VGRYGSASEVVRDVLRGLEERKKKLEVLRMHLAEGAELFHSKRYTGSGNEEG
jgi:antitoxin ParD1/3/4